MTYLSWAKDLDVLADVAHRETESFDTTSEQTRALNSYVYKNRGFAKNDKYFVTPRLGPTPIQVLEFGGDCADKSRLLSALLARIEVESTLAMLYPCESCPSGHTVVEARFPGDSIVLDPVYDIDFPDSSGGFFGLDELSRNHAAVVSRVRDLRRARGAQDKINGYEYQEMSYRVVRTVNWNSNVLTRLVGSALRALGYDPFLVRRPHFLEDPKLFLSIVSFLMCLPCVFLGVLGQWFVARTRATSTG